MSQNNNGNDGNGSGGSGSGGGLPKVGWGVKVGYIGTGVLIGLIAYPFVRKALTKIQPKMDKVFDDLTGKAEEYAEKASDLLAKAKMSMKENGSAHTHDHDDHDHNGKKAPLQ
jgi:hypothetical protein